MRWCWVSEILAHAPSVRLCASRSVVEYPHVPQEAVRLCCAAPSEVQAVLVKVWAAVSVVEYPQEQLTVRLCWDESVEVQLP